jgi:hypothetical protein
MVVWKGCGKFAGSNQIERIVFAGSKLRMAKIRENRSLPRRVLL